MPTRVLDLGEPKWPKNSSLVMQYLQSSLKLVEAAFIDVSSYPDGVPYICLSHCWGDESSPVLKTTTHNIKEHKETISWSRLPKTFQDAVLFTRKLRVRYLWIDSLCIIQNDVKDWEIEAAKMCTVFQGSWLTLSALKASNCSQGLFSKYCTKCASGTSCNAHGIKLHPLWEVYARPIISPTSLGIKYWDTTSPLLKRAWVYQERLLSPRILHFGDTELIWECSSETTCEWSLMQPAVNPKVSHDASLQDGDSSALHRRWRDVVAEYSSLALTFETDRLAALKGLAAQFQANTSFASRYFAGLWEKTFLFDLTWQPLFRDHKNVRKQALDGVMWPSWSWISVTGGVSYSFEDPFKPMAEVLAIDSNEAGQNPRQPNEPGCITLEGCIIAVPTCSEMLQTPKFDLYNLIFDDVLQDLLHEADVEYPYDTPEADDFAQGLFIFLLGARTAPKYEYYESDKVDHPIFLILKEIPEKNGKFERVGIVDGQRLRHSPIYVRKVDSESLKVMLLQIQKQDSTLR